LQVIVLPTETGEGLDSRIASTLEEAKHLTLVKVEDGKVVEVKSVLVKVGDHVPSLARKLGANVVICDELSGRSRAYFAVLGFDIISGVDGLVKDAVNAFLEGRISFVPEEFRRIKVVRDGQ